MPLKLSGSKGNTAFNSTNSMCQVHFGRLHKIVDVVGHVVDQVVVQLKWKEKHLENSSKNLVLKRKMVNVDPRNFSSLGKMGKEFVRSNDIF